MEFELMLTVIPLAAIVSVSAVLVAKMHLKTDEYSGKMKKNMEKYVAELEDDNKYLTKQMNAMKKGVKISESDMEDPIGAIGAMLPQIEHLVPAKFKPFLRDPKLMQFASKMIQDNPDAAKKLLSKFVSKKGRNEVLAGDTSNEAVFEV
jgi:hypothetical protein